MAANFYGVKKGKKTGIFLDWNGCKEAVTGYPGAEYKGFAQKAEVCRYLGIDEGEFDFFLADAGEKKHRDEEKRENSVSAADSDVPKEGCLLAYVDGSYSDSLKRYAFGCVFLLHDGRVFTEFGNGSNPKSLEQRNVTGEMLGAMYAVKFAMKNGFEAVEIRYDYQGIESWVTGAWKSKNELTQKYAASMREWGKSIRISFTKVAAHSNVKYNELADQTAKKGLTEGNGIPPVRLIGE